MNIRQGGSLPALARDALQQQLPLRGVKTGVDVERLGAASPARGLRHL